LGDCSAVIGQPRAQQVLSFNFNGEQVLGGTPAAWQQAWSETSRQIQRLRDNAERADHEFERLADHNHPALRARLSYDPNADVAPPFINTGMRPAVAILREQGVNGQVEMAAAFTRAGFTAIDVHMSDILSGRVDLADFRGLV